MRRQFWKITRKHGKPEMTRNPVAWDRHWKNEVAFETQKYLRFFVTARVVTGNCKVGFNLVKWKITTASFCWGCNKEENTKEHLLCQCQTLEGRWLGTAVPNNYGTSRITESIPARCLESGNFAGKCGCFTEGTRMKGLNNVHMVTQWATAFRICKKLNRLQRSISNLRTII